MIKKSLLIVLAIICLTAFSASAQSQVPVRWRTSVKMTSVDEGVITVKALVTNGWHLYGTKLPSGGPRATVFDFNTSTGIKFISDFIPSTNPTEDYDKMFNLKLNFWSSNVTFTRKFRITDVSKARINGKIIYMACNGTNCMPPKTESVKLAVPSFKK